MATLNGDDDVYTGDEICKMFYDADCLNEEFKKHVLVCMNAYFQAMYNSIHRPETMVVGDPSGDTWQTAYNQIAALYQKHAA